MSELEGDEDQPAPRGRVLVVDDEPLGIKVLEAALHGIDCDVVSARSGLEAIARADADPPDLILLDILMPGMDGIEVCRRIRASERLREVPVVLVTTLDSREARLDGLNAGADDFLTKPIDLQEVQARARTIIRLNRFRRLRAEVERARDAAVQAREYARRLVFAEEGERRRIARELHDNIGQQLALIKMSLAALRSSDTRVQEITGLVDEAIQQVRELSRALRPSLLDDAGLVSALRSLATRLRHTGVFDVRIEAPERCPRYDPALETACFRIVQEAITNAMRHSVAAWVDVRVEPRDDELLLTVRDEGSGFDVANALRRAMLGESLGLLGMQERARLCKGDVRIVSVPGEGTVVHARFPVARGSESGEARV